MAHWLSIQLTLTELRGGKQWARQCAPFKVYFSPWKLIWAAGSTLYRVCLGRSSTSWKPKASGKNKRYQQNPRGLPVTGGWLAAVKGASWLRGPPYASSRARTWLAMDLRKPHAMSDSTKRVPAGRSRTSLLPSLHAPPTRAGSPPRRVLPANQTAAWPATNLRPAAARERGKSRVHLEFHGLLEPWLPLRCPRYVGADAH